MKRKLERLQNLAIGDTIIWQERPTKVLGKRTVSPILVQLRLLILPIADEEKENAAAQDRPVRDTSFWTRPIAAGLVVRRT